METIVSDIRSRCTLASGDAAELAARVAELSQAGLPLPDGLRALADELPGRRSRRAFTAMAARLELGDSLDAVLDDAGKELPVHLRGLLVAGLRSGGLPETMGEYAKIERERHELRHRLLASLAYLTFLSLAVTVFSFFIQTVFRREAGFMIEPQQGTFLGMFSVVGWKMFAQVPVVSAVFSLLLLLMSLSLCDFRWLAWVTPISDNLPFVGPLLRNLRLASWCRVTSLLLENETPLPDAVRLAGAAAGDLFLARDCWRAAAKLERGRPLSESIADSQRFSRNLISLVEWGQKRGTLPENLCVAARLHDNHAKSQSVFTNSVLAPSVLLVIAGLICLAGSIVVMLTAANAECMRFYTLLGNRVPVLNIPAGFDFSSMLSPLLVGCAVLLTNRLVAPRRDPANENAVEGLLKIVGWVLVVVGLLGNLALMMAPLSIVWIPVLIIGWTFIELKRRRVLQQALLETMAVSAERRLPLSPAVRAFAEDVGGRFGRRAAELATLLEVGETLPDALGQVDGLMPRDAMPSVRVGYRSGALARGLAQAAAMDDRQKELWGPFAAKMLYAAGLPCIACGSVLFTLVFVVRLYHQVLKSLGDPPLPRLTLALLQLSDYLEVGWPFLALVAGIFVFLFLYGVLRYLGVPLLDLPGTGHMLRRQHTAAILENLALAVEHGHSLYGTIHALGKCYPKKAIRNKLNCVATDIENGIAWCESLRHRGLVGEADFAVLQSAERLGNLPWAMEETAKSNRRRLALRLKVLMQLLFPPVVLGFGAIVLFMVVAVFLPLLTIMRCWSNP